MVKTFKKLLLQNILTDDLETWRAALSKQVLPTLFKLGPLSDHDSFYEKFKFGHLGFVWE